jgi:UDP-N-acetylglucosamine 2-epimerase
MRTTSVFLVGGARPNFMKVAPLYHAFKKSGLFDVTFLVGNVMIDTLRRQSTAAETLAAWTRFDVAEQGYAVATLHRPSNVDDEATLGALMQSLADTRSCR